MTQSLQICPLILAIPMQNPCPFQYKPFWCSAKSTSFQFYITTTHTIYKIYVSTVVVVVYIHTTRSVSSNKQSGCQTGPCGTGVVSLAGMVNLQWLLSGCAEGGDEWYRRMLLAAIYGTGRVKLQLTHSCSKPSCVWSKVPWVPYGTVSNKCVWVHVKSAPKHVRYECMYMNKGFNKKALGLHVCIDDRK